MRRILFTMIMMVIRGVTSDFSQQIQRDPAQFRALVDTGNRSQEAKLGETDSDSSAKSQTAIARSFGSYAY